MRKGMVIMGTVMVTMMQMRGGGDGEGAGG